MNWFLYDGNIALNPVRLTEWLSWQPKSISPCSQVMFPHHINRSDCLSIAYVHVLFLHELPDLEEEFSGVQIKCFYIHPVGEYLKLSVKTVNHN